MVNIGQRAAELIYQRASEKAIDFKEECFLIDLNPKSLSDWKCGKCDPSAYYLRVMCLNGYDIIYILTGEKHER